ncbi:MAG: ribulose-phosphate 3-epimerase [Thermaurantiacus sp.]
MPRSPNPILIAPSILSADFACLGEEVRAVVDAGADWVHVDVMDGHFVPNLTIGPDVVKALRPVTDRPFDVHLMVAPVDPWIPRFAEAGSDIITVHVESGPHVHRSLQTVAASGRKMGVTLNPGTSVEMLRPVIGMVDLVLVMSVNPGFGGQAFIPEAVERVAAIRAMAGEHPLRIEVDGGVAPETIGALAEAGADTFVAGSAVFRGGRGSYAANIRALRKAASGD